MKTYSAFSSALLVSALAVTAPQAQAFGLGDIKAAVPGSGGGSTAGAVSAGDIDAFIKTAQDADAMISSASDYIFHALVNKEDIAKLEATKAAANNIADPKEKGAALEKIKADEATATQKELASDDIQTKLSAMSKEQLHAFSNAAFTFVLGMLKDKQLADGSSTLVSGVTANPMLATRLPALKDVVTSVAAQAANTAKIGEGLVKLASAGKIAAMPTSTSDKSKKVSTM